jgi:hypothetical protein
MFIFYDGDNIGERFERLYLANDLATLKLLSKTMIDIHAEIDGICRLMEGPRVIEAGGDEGLIECERSLADLLIINIRNVWDGYGMGATVGVGETPRDAYLAVSKMKKLES